MTNRPDSAWMDQALAYAARGLGYTRPNPPVGAVIVRGEQLLGAGWHHRAGGPHAETEALANCRETPNGATMYVTLEPCSTTGRTTPCTDRLIKAGLDRVVVGTTDPNPAHAGRGLDLLVRAGIKVKCGVRETQARDLIRPFAKWIVEGRPWITLKLAITMDGNIADRSGRSKWITGEQARQSVQEWRRRREVVMVGAGTVVADNPSLRCRLDPEPPTLRLVVDGQGATPPTARVLQDGFAARTIIATTRRAPLQVRREWAAQGAAVWLLPARRSHVDLDALVSRLGRAGCPGVLCEGGAHLAGELVRQGLVDEYLFFIAPRLLADKRALHALAGSGFLLPESPALSIVEALMVGPDLCLRAFPATPGKPGSKRSDGR